MESIRISFSVVSPLFLLMALGYFLRRIGWWEEEFILKLNGFSYKVFFSTYLFISVYNTDLSQAFNQRLMIFAISGTFIVFTLSALSALIFSRQASQRGVIAQGMARSNTLLLGLPVVVALCGEEHAGEVALVIAAIVPLYNVLSVILLEIFRGGNVRFSKIVRQVLTNPLIIGAALAVACLLLKIRLPDMVIKAVSDIAKIATPLALMVLGGTFEFSSLRGNTKALLGVCFGKLVIMPMLAITAGILLGLRGVELAVLLALFATPTAASSFTMAEQMEGDYQLAGQIVVFTTALSVITLFVWVVILLNSGLMNV